jgi:hypothetical protein
MKESAVLTRALAVAAPFQIPATNAGGERSAKSRHSLCLVLFCSGGARGLIPEGNCAVPEGMSRAAARRSAREGTGHPPPTWVMRRLLLRGGWRRGKWRHWQCHRVGV